MEARFSRNSVELKCVDPVLAIPAHPIEPSDPELLRANLHVSEAPPMSWGKFIVSLLIAGAMAYGGYLVDLPQAVWIGTGALVFVVAVATGMK